MADQKISELDAKVTLADTDLVPMVDIEAEPDATKKITGANVKAQVLAGHKDLTTGVHGVGANYLAYTKSSQKEALFHNNYMAYAWMSGDLATENNVEITVQLDTEVYDPGANFDTANYRYEAPVAGYYQIIGGLSWDWSGMVADKVFYAKILIGAAPVDSDVRHSASVDRLANRCSSIQHLDVDDLVYLHALQVSGVDTPILSGDDQGQCFMQVFLMQAD